MTKAGVEGCCKLIKTWDCDEHLFRQVSAWTGRYQLPIFRCTKVHLRRDARPQCGCHIDDVMSYNSLTTLVDTGVISLTVNNPYFKFWWHPNKLDHFVPVIEMAPSLSMLTTFLFSLQDVMLTDDKKRVLNFFNEGLPQELASIQVTTYL